MPQTTTPEFNADLISRYDQSGPRYTSYPTAARFTPDFTESDYRRVAEESNQDPIPCPLSIYVHIPFCDTVCFYCACNKVVTKNHARADSYLDHVYREIAMQAKLFDPDRTVAQLHWGGGTPTFLDNAQLRRLMQVIREHFSLLPDDEGEYSIEIDPRTADAEKIQLLREIGFNRLSMGVQDLDLLVQKAVNRIQTTQATRQVMDTARAAGFSSINVDLMYGLPFQTVRRFSHTLDQVLYLDPDRIAVYNYAHLPERFKPQRRINEGDLPSPAEKLDILQHTIEQLTMAGYVYIGMDHFAKPEDELALAQQSGTLHRNFQGYSTHAECDLVAVGITAIGKVGDSYSQNVRNLDEYYERIDAGHLALERGVELEPDDRLRREIITQLMCHFELDVSDIEKQWGFRFSHHFAPEMQALKAMQDDGLLSLEAGRIAITPAGRLLVRNICMVFDRYLRDKEEGRGYSRVI